jgi:hypothetical protein
MSRLLKLVNDIHDRCQHYSVVPWLRYDDGSIDGRCEECGDVGFPIVDKAYEEWLVAEAEERRLANERWVRRSWLGKKWLSVTVQLRWRGRKLLRRLGVLS